MDKIFSFEPYLKSVIWGGDKIKRLKAITSDLTDIGESWEISGVTGHESVVTSGEDAGLTICELIGKYKGALIGEPVYGQYGNYFPLLVKFIDAHDKLSLQVHPDDDLAAARHNSPGKTEMWYVIGADADSYIIAGLSQPLTPDEYRRRVADNSLTEVLAHHKSNIGDVFLITPGRLHAIGQGNLIVEIQQPSDITYRVYDYNRRGLDGKPRQLHIEEAAEAIDYSVCDDYIVDYDHDAAGEASLVKCNYFNVKKISVDGELTLSHDGKSFVVLVCIDGNCDITVDGTEHRQLTLGHTLLVAASARDIVLTGNAVLLSATVPAKA